MQIIIRNNAQLPRKYLRFIKWKIYGLRAKFQQLIYAEVYLKAEGQSPKTYMVTVCLGVRGNDIIIQNKSKSIGEVFRKTYTAVHRYLNKDKNKNIRKKF